jgi:DNA repair protein RecO (recombination protein O)
MLHKTRGIVLHTVKYSETSLIVKVYTEAFGIQSYMVKGARNPKSKLRPILFQPLTLLELVAYHKERNTLQSIKEIRLAHPYQSMPFDIRKSSIALFLNEVVYRSVGEEESNPALFEFLWSSFLLLDAVEEPFMHFHLLFTIKLTKYLGFHPRNTRTDEHCFFNLSEGTFQPLFIEGTPGAACRTGPSKSLPFPTSLQRSATTCLTHCCSITVSTCRDSPGSVPPRFCTASSPEPFG